MTLRKILFIGFVFFPILCFTQESKKRRFDIYTFYTAKILPWSSATIYTYDIFSLKKRYNFEIGTNFCITKQLSLQNSLVLNKDLYSIQGGKNEPNIEYRTNRLALHTGPSLLLNKSENKIFNNTVAVLICPAILLNYYTKISVWSSPEFHKTSYFGGVSFKLRYCAEFTLFPGNRLLIATSIQSPFRFSIYEKFEGTWLPGIDIGYKLIF